MGYDERLTALLTDISAGAGEAKPCDIEQHAAMFALLTRAAMEAKGDPEGEDVIIRAVTRYAEERGERMAERAKQNGDPLDLVNSIAYGEWAAKPGQKVDVAEEFSPSYITQTLKCPWAEAWQQHDLLPYGKFYCKTVDDAVFHGFNPDFTCTVHSTLSWGGDCCRFDWNQPMSPEDAERLERKRAALGLSAKRDFSFHTAHLLHTIGRYLTERYGEEGYGMIRRVLGEFARLFGSEFTASLIGLYP